jgi:hypothetical protein
MKKPEEYLEKANRPYRNHVKIEYEYINKLAGIESIQQARLDTIDELIERMQKSLSWVNAALIWHVGENLKNDLK